MTRDEVKKLLNRYYNYLMDEFDGAASEEAIDIILDEEFANEKESICELINDEFSWVMKVDGEVIQFQGSANADYYAEHYSKLGYKIIWDKDKWKRKQQEYGSK